MPNPPLRNIINVAINLAILDGGFVIAIQIIDCLLNYFGSSLFGSAGSLDGIGKIFIISSLLSILNMSVIITRITGLARGVKLSATACYGHALQRWPTLFMLYILGSLALMVIGTILMKLFTAFIGLDLIQYTKLMMLAIFALIPYCLFACTFVIDQGQNAFNAIKSTLYLVKYKIRIPLLINLSLLYSIPLYLSHTFPQLIQTPLLTLLCSLWILFCHLITLVIYISADERQDVSKNNQSRTAKVIII